MQKIHGVGCSRNGFLLLSVTAAFFITLAAFTAHWSGVRPSVCPVVDAKAAADASYGYCVGSAGKLSPRPAFVSRLSTDTLVLPKVLTGAGYEMRPVLLV